MTARRPSAGSTPRGRASSRGLAHPSPAGAERRPARPRLTPARSLAVVRERLQGYADRGVFRGFSEQSPAAGRYRFRFSW
ncbi:MAG: hypothetical protein VX975_06395 [Acidobacteriota bacterium]|nr:hypothetical protein [Acidobacteriota bacterium]